MLVNLSWADIDPRRREFDAELVRPALERIVMARADMFGRSPPRGEIEEAIDRAIIAHYGDWARGWRWSPNEPGGGGPTLGWCCERDSVFRDDDPGPLATAERAHGALVNWRQFLEQLDRTFAMLRVETASLDTAREIERVAGRLLALVVERTNGEDAWYRTFAATLGWYLEAAGITDESAYKAASRVISGRFASWVTPDRDAAKAACKELGSSVASSTGPAQPRDALADWRTLRAHPVAVTAGLRGPVACDGHADYIDVVDRERSDERAEHMASALLLCRDSAQRGMALTFDQLAEWQGVVLGTSAPAPLRTTDAFGKSGRERYPYSPELRDELDRALAEAGDPAVSVAVRAARAYLDICYFHPFVDGNGRASRLALDHVLTSAGLVLRVADPVFRLSRGGDDPRGLWSLAVVIERSLATRVMS